MGTVRAIRHGVPTCILLTLTLVEVVIRERLSNYAKNCPIAGYGAKVVFF